MNSILRGNRKWLSPSEAAKELQTALGEPVTQADVLRLVLDGHLVISVRLPAAAGEGYFRRAEDDRELETFRIERVLPIWLEGSGRRQIESEFHYLSDLPHLSMEASGGASVWFDGGLRELKPDRGASGFYPRAAAAIPYGSSLVIAREELDAAIARLRPDLPQSQNAKQAGGSERPLQTRERTTLLLMIAALAREANVDTSKPFKAAEALAAVLESAGYPVAPRTIAEHLKSANDAMSPEGRNRE